jgi:hypothetical protein
LSLVHIVSFIICHRFADHQKPGEMPNRPTKYF